jgi:hypothetical protein
MRNKHLLLALIIVLLPPALAGAATVDQPTATADCNGWSSDVTIGFSASSTRVLLQFSMQLADSTGVEIERFDSEEWVVIPASLTGTWSFSGTWQAPLAQPALLTVTANVYDTRQDTWSLVSDWNELQLTCPAGGGTPAVVCHHAARWWLHHRGQWPVTSVTLGSATYDEIALERLLRSPHRGQIARRLAHQLAVAKLNLANGATNDIADQVSAADAWLSTNPLDADRRHQPSNRARRDALRLIKDLCVWNHASCEDGSLLAGDDERAGDAGTLGLSFDAGAGGAEFTGDLADYPTPDKAEEETTSLGTLKAMYR